MTTLLWIAVILAVWTTISFLAVLAYTCVLEIARWRRQRPFRRLGYLDLTVRRDS